MWSLTSCQVVCISPFAVAVAVGFLWVHQSGSRTPRLSSSPVMVDIVSSFFQ